jgi:anti-sigma regulatory factor (Ser/Thr protein kinase)
MSSIETTITNSIDEIARIAALVESLASAQSLPVACVWPLNVALDEILSNIINYGYTDNDAHEIRVRISLECGLVVAEIEDDGQPFDPLSTPTPELDVPLEERAIGGLGVHLVRNLMTEVSYARVAGRNLLTMKRLITEGRGGSA